MDQYTHERRLVHAAGWAGIVGPIWLCGTIGVLSVVQYEFMQTLGWHPLDAPTFDWPSGLALGPYGGAMTAAFLGCGALLPIFAAGLHRLLAPGSALGPVLLAASGVAMLLLAAPTDPTLAGVRTPAGYLHDAAFVGLGLTLFPGLLLTARRMHADPRWRIYARLMILVLAAGIPAFLLKGPFFYAMLLVVPGWFALAGRQIIMQTTQIRGAPGIRVQDHSDDNGR